MFHNVSLCTHWFHNTLAWYYYPCYHLLQAIYNCMPETHHVSRAYRVTAVLYVQFVPHVKLFRPWNTFCSFTSVFCAVCVKCQMWLLFVVPWFRALPVCCSGIVSEILTWFQSPLLLPVSLLLSHSTCAEFLLCGLYISKSSQFVPIPHFCLQELQHQ